MAVATLNEMRWIHAVQVVIAVLFLVNTTSVVLAANSSTTHKFLLMVASGSNPDSSAVVSAVNQTLEEINMTFSFQLKYNISDTQCNVRKAIQMFHNVMTTDSSVVAVVGCGCSTATEEVAKISHLWNVPVISYASTSVVLSDRSVYRNFFRTVPSDELMVSAVAAIMDSFGWRQLSVFTEEQPQFIQLYQHLKNRQLKTPNITRVKSYCFERQQLHNYTIFANDLAFVFDEQPHIYLLNTSPRAATYVLCSAYHNERFYPNYAWILLGHHDTDWWREHYMETNCTDTEMRNVLNRNVILIPYPDNNSNEVDMLPESLYESGGFYNATNYVVDAVWTLAHALNNCISTTNNTCNGHLGKFISNVSVNNERQVNFIDGDRQASTVVVQQYQNKVGEQQLRTPVSVDVVVDKGNNVFRLNFFNTSTVWPDGVPPDGTPLTVIIKSELVEMIIQGILTTITTFFIAVCLGFNIIFRKRKIVKLTSPNLNYVMIIGVTALVISASIFRFEVTALVALKCVIDRVFASFGYDICIGVALVKTWRVVYIFKYPKPGKRPPKDWQLLLAVGVIVLVDMCISVPLITLNLLNDELSLEVNNEQSPKLNERGILENYYIFSCETNIYYHILVILTIFYKLVLHAVALVLSFLTRNIKVDVLNDYRYNTIIIIASSFLMLAMIVSTLLFSDYHSRYEIVWAIIVFLVNSSYLGLTFIPKMVALYKDPQGKNVFKSVAITTQVRSTDASGSTVYTKNTVPAVEEGGSELTLLRERVSQLEVELKLYKEKEIESEH